MMNVSEIINTLATKGFENIEVEDDQVIAESGLDGGYGITIVPIGDWLRCVLWESYSGSTISDRIYQDLDNAISIAMTVASIDFAIESGRIALISKR